ncbi:hypothetical protein CB1_000649001 [Camelus ferus]|nr:hypothetical protein CB1_000649001 [Camelus ferus]
MSVQAKLLFQKQSAAEVSSGITSLGTATYIKKIVECASLRSVYCFAHKEPTDPWRFHPHHYGARDNVTERIQRSRRLALTFLPLVGYDGPIGSNGSSPSAIFIMWLFTTGSVVLQRTLLFASCGIMSGKWKNNMRMPRLEAPTGMFVENPENKVEDL